MAAEFPLTLTIKALDKATGPLRAMTAKLQRITAPFRAFGKDFAKFSEAAGLAKIGAAFKGVGAGVAGVGREAFALGAKLFALAGVAGFAMFSIVKGAVEVGDKLGEMAARTGTTVDFYASFSHAAAQADIDQGAFNGAMDQFNKRVGELRANSGPLLAFLNKVSPTLGKQIKGAKSTEAALSLMTDAMHRIKDPAKRAAFAAAAFGRSGLQMGAFLGQGTAAIQEQQAAFMRLSGSQEAFAKGAGDLDNAMRETETAFLGLRSAAMGALFPAFTKLSKALTDFLVKHRDGIAKWAKGAADAISAWVEGGGIERVIAGLREFGAKLAWVYEKIGGLKGVLVAVGLFMAGPLLLAIAGLIPAVFSLGAALAPLALAALPFVTAALPFIAAAVGIAAAAKAIYDNWAGIKLFFSDMWIEISYAFRKAWAVISPIVDKLGGAMAILQNPVGAMFKGGALAVNHLMGADAAKPLGAEAARGSREAGRVEVDFANVPPGVSVSAVSSSSAQPVDLSVGRSMLVPQ